MFSCVLNLIEGPPPCSHTPCCVPRPPPDSHTHLPHTGWCACYRMHTNRARCGATRGCDATRGCREAASRSTSRVAGRPLPRPRLTRSRVGTPCCPSCRSRVRVRAHNGVLRCWLTPHRRRRSSTWIGHTWRCAWREGFAHLEGFPRLWFSTGFRGRRDPCLPMMVGVHCKASHGMLPDVHTLPNSRRTS